MRVFLFCYTKSGCQVRAIYQVSFPPMAANDIRIIAKNTGFSQIKITKIKENIFFKQHQLDDGVRLFAPDPDIADAWFRLQKGNYNDQDIRLLEHEYFESRFEGIFKTDYRTAHNATIKSGRTWNP